MTAKATTKTFREAETRFPKSARTPKAKAISVAIGIPIPAWVGELDTRNSDLRKALAVLKMSFSHHCEDYTA